MANPYTRQSSFSDGDTINSSLFNNEYNALVLSFSATVGHTHDGSTGEGAPITKVGPTQDIVVASTTILPKTNNTVDLGSSSLKFKDAYFAGNVNVDGVVTHSGNMTIGNAATDTLTINATIQGSSLVFEGATANAHELTLGIPDVTSDVTVTLPNATDTLVGRATTDTLTNKTLGATAFTGAITTTSTVDGRDVATDGTKLDAIEASATADQTAAQIKTHLENGIDSVHYVDGSIDTVHIGDDQVTAAKLANSINSEISANTAKTGITSAQASAITANTAKTGITSAQASAITANTAKTGITSAQTSAITANTAKITYPASASNKLAGIEASADVTDTANVVAALSAGTGVGITGAGVVSVTAVALSTVQTAANQTAHLALTAQEGDIVVRADENKSYVHNGGSAGNMNDYTLLATPTDSVLSVNGVTGAITAAHIATAVEAASGSNTFTDADHTKLNAIEASATADQTAAQIKTHLEDGIDSVHYVDGSIDLVHMSINSIDSPQYVDGSIDLAHMSPNSVDSDQYVDGSIDTIHIAGDQITSALIADDQIDSEHYVDGSIDSVHIAASNITNALMADDAIGLAELSATGTAGTTTFLRGDNTWSVPIGGVTSVNGVTGAITAANIATAVEAASGSNTFTDADHSKLNAIAASANNYVHPNHSGDVVSTADGATVIQVDAVDIPMLSATGTASTSTFLRGDNTWAAAGSTSASDLTSGTLPIARIADGAITGAKIAAGTVVASDVADDAITTAKILDSNVTVAKMAANSVDSAQYVDGSIDLAHMSINSIDSDQYVDGSIDTIHIATSNITNALMADDSVDSAEIVAGAVDLAHMSANSVDSPQYVDGSIDSIHLAGNIISNDKIADDAVDEANLKVSNAPTDGFILTAEAANVGGMTWAAASTASIGDDSVTYSKIQNVSATDRILGRDSAGAGIIEEITPANLRTMLGVETGATADQTAAQIKTHLENGIDSVHYVDGSIDLAHMSANSIDSTQYVDGSIDTAHYAGGSVDTTALADDAVTAAKLANSINTEIAANTAKTGITSGQASAITANTAKTGITSGQASAITANTAKTTNATHTGDVTGSGALTIAADAVTGAKIADNAINSEHYTDGSIDRVHLAADIIDSTKIADNVTLGGNVTVSGNLTISGDTTTVNTATLAVEDPLISLATGNNGADAVDIGMYGLYDTSGSQDLYGGLFRDASDSGKWKLFKDNQAAPGTTVNVSGTGYAVGTLVANLEGSVTAANSVDSDQYVNGSIDEVHLSDNSVDSRAYVDESIDTAHIADAQITLAKMSTNSVSTNQYVNGSIQTDHITNSNITLAKMAANSVDSSQYVDGSIDEVHLSDNSVDSRAYVDGSIDAAHIATGTITATQLAANSVDSSELVDNSVDASHLNVSGNGTTSQFLRSDGDGTMTWVTPTDTNTTYSVGAGGLTQQNFTTTLKNKLDAVAASANNYSLPEATATAKGGIELFSNTDQSVAATAVSATASRTYGLQLNSAGQGVVNVPWVDTNTTYSVGAGGLTQQNFTTTLKNKLDAVAASANNYSLPEATATAKGGIELFSNTDQSVAATAVSATASRTYGLQLNSAGQGVVNVPWVDTNTNTNTTYTASTGLTLTGTAFSIATDGVDSQHYATGSIDAAHIASNTITATQLAADCVGASELANDSVGSANIIANSIVAGDIAAGAVGNSELAADCVTGAKIANDAINSEHYANGSIDNAHIADNAIGSEHYATGSVDATAIQNDAINSQHYTNSSIDTAHIGDLQVTGAKLALDHRAASLSADVKVGNSHDYMFADASHGLRFYTANAEEMRLEDDGDLHVDGNIVAYSATVSDERLKHDIKPIENALDKVGQLNGCTFTYNADGKESAGLIAQDVEKVLPSAVTEKKLPLKIDDGNEYKVLQYDQTIGLLVEAIKELTAKVEKLENK